MVAGCDEYSGAVFTGLLSYKSGFFNDWCAPWYMEGYMFANSAAADASICLLIMGKAVGVDCGGFKLDVTLDVCENI